MREVYKIYVAQAIFGLCLLFVVIWAVFFKTYEIGLSQDTSIEEEYEAYFYEDIRDNAIYLFGNIVNKIKHVAKLFGILGKRGHYVRNLLKR